MVNDAISKELDALQLQLDELAQQLLANDASQVHHHSAQVHALVSAIGALASRQAPPGLRRDQARLQAMFHEMAALRVQMARRQAYVDQSLRLLIPAATQATTYEGSKSLYAGAGRASGSLRSVSA